MAGGIRQGRLRPGKARSAIAGALFSSAPADSWQARAECKDSELSLFVEGDDLDGVRRNERRAKAFAICERCTVVTECLDDAIEHRDLGVIRGDRIFKQVWRGAPPPRVKDSEKAKAARAAKLNERMRDAQP